MTPVTRVAGWQWWAGRETCGAGRTCPHRQACGVGAAVFAPHAFAFARTLNATARCAPPASARASKQCFSRRRVYEAHHAAAQSHSPPHGIRGIAAHNAQPNTPTWGRAAHHSNSTLNACVCVRARPHRVRWCGGDGGCGCEEFVNEPHAVFRAQYSWAWIFLRSGRSRR